MDVRDFIEDTLGGEFIRFTGGCPVYEFRTMEAADKAIGVGGLPYNYAPWDAPKGLAPSNGALPQVSFPKGFL